MLQLCGGPSKEETTSLLPSTPSPIVVGAWARTSSQTSLVSKTISGFGVCRSATKTTCSVPTRVGKPSTLTTRRRITPRGKCALSTAFYTRPLPARRNRALGPTPRSLIGAVIGTVRSITRRSSAGRPFGRSIGRLRVASPPAYSRRIPSQVMVGPRRTFRITRKSRCLKLMLSKRIQRRRACRVPSPSAIATARTRAGRLKLASPFLSLVTSLLALTSRKTRTTTPRTTGTLASRPSLSRLLGRRCLRSAR